MTIKKQIIKVFIVLFLVSLPTFAFADGLVPCGGPTESPCTVKHVFILAIRVTNTLVGLAGIYAVYLIVGHGFWLIVTMGNEEAIAKRKKGIAQAVVGFVMAMMAYMFVNTVVNVILLTTEKKECKIDLKDPLNYLVVHSDPTKHAECRK